MSVASQDQTAAKESKLDSQAGSGAGVRLILDLSKIDLTKRMYSKEDIAKYNPHRGNMALIDSIVWESADHTKGVAHKRVLDDEFWVKGHFPDKAMMPGVLMIEAGAQLACFLYNIRRPDPKIVAFLRIEQASFRSMVQPGDDLYLLCSEVKFGRRNFESDIQGIVSGRIAFDARISGMSLSPESRT